MNNNDNIVGALVTDETALLQAMPDKADITAHLESHALDSLVVPHIGIWGRFL